MQAKRHPDLKIRAEIVVNCILVEHVLAELEHKSDITWDQGYSAMAYISLN